VSDLLQTTIDNAGAQVLFGALLLLLFAVSLVAVLFFLLMVRAVWRWLTCHNWNDVIVNTERRALRGK
jgi:hypothetical protein